MPVAAIHAAGSPLTPRRNSAIAVRAYRRHPAETTGEVAQPRAEIEHEGRQSDSRPFARAERPAELFDDAAERNRLRLHQIPAHGSVATSSMSRAGEPRDRRGDILDRDRLERRRGFVRGQFQRKRRQRAHHGAAAIGRRRDHKARPQDRVGNAGRRDQPLGLALGLAEGGAVLIRGAGDRDMDQRIARPLSLIACSSRATKSRCTAPVSLPGPSCSTPRQLTTTSMPRSRISRASAARIHRHHGQLQIERAWPLRRRKLPRDADHLKAPRAQIVGDEPPDQAGSAEHQDFA